MCTVTFFLIVLRFALKSVEETELLVLVLLLHGPLGLTIMSSVFSIPETFLHLAPKSK